VSASIPERPEEQVVGPATSVVDPASPDAGVLVPCAASSSCVVRPHVRAALDDLRRRTGSKWPGSRVLVLCGLDTQFEHGATSPLYEGRAVELRMEDGDPAKLAPLARLAHESGFEWVGRVASDRIRASRPIAK
jgi:hypothetical protein